MQGPNDDAIWAWSAALRNPSPVIHAGAAVILLLIAAGLSVLKPRCLTRYGWRRQQRDREQRASATAGVLPPP